MNYDEMREKQDANMLNHVATLVGKDPFYFFPLLLKNSYCIFSYCNNVKGPISRDSWGQSVYREVGGENVKNESSSERNDKIMSELAVELQS